MLASLARAVFGSHNERIVRSLNRAVQTVAALEPTISKLTDQDLRAQTAKLRARLAAGEALDAVLPEAFATVREAAKRTLGQRHFDVQIMGGVVLHQGKIAEMKTGEGKTLVATLPVYLNALSGKGVHVITVNDYLAKRDSAWMGQIYQFLGMSVGVIVHGLSDEERKAAYACDITYGTNNEFGFDYLRDNMKFSLSELAQRPFNFAIVDEVDSILVDEARTPLIISGPAEDSSELYVRINAIIPQLESEHIEKDEKMRSVTLTETGNERAEELLSAAGLLPEGLNLYDSGNVHIVHHVNQALRAHHLFARDTDYIVKGGKVIIIDEFTGRMMEGRRYSEGLHQALEAKEGVEIQRENQTLASITFQNYFRLYPKLAGMTGTAMTEAAEFQEIYGLDVVEMPTNVTVSRIDMDDEVYRDLKDKHEAILAQIKECRDRQQPVLVGTVSIEKSEMLAALLTERGIPHQVLNARHHEQEASIIAQAGRPGAVTIATNMAGRGTDIQLGGNLDARVAEELKDHPDDFEKPRKITKIRTEIAAAREVVRKAGGLFVIGTERHESRRIDNQLRGRSGRQGDPGASKFFLSLEDDLMRIFGSDRMEPILARLGLRDGEKIAHPWISKALAKAQEKVEARNFDIRKNLLKYDNIMNDQRKVIYEQRRDIMAADRVTETIRSMRNDLIEEAVKKAIPEHSYPEQWDLVWLKERIKDLLGIEAPVEEWGKEDGIAENEFRERLTRAAEHIMAQKASSVGAEVMTRIEKAALLGLLDGHWKEHLLSLDHLRQGIHLRGYGQRDPFNEYQREAFELFGVMMNETRADVVRTLLVTNFRVPTLEELAEQQRRQKLEEVHEAPPQLASEPPQTQPQPGSPINKPIPLHVKFDQANPETWRHTPRNGPCPCGSGRKYKHCHGAIA